MAKGEIVERVVTYVVKSIVEDADAVQVTMVEQGPDEYVAEVRTAKPDMGRVIGRRGRVAKAIRAVAENKDVAALMGIDVNRTIGLTFATGAAMAGVAGMLYALVFHQVHYFMGFIPGIKAFTSAVLGGIGSIPGAAVGGLFLGLFESLGPSLFLQSLGIPAFNQLKDVIAFTMLVLVLIFRPQGIVGERLKEKKA